MGKKQYRQYPTRPIPVSALKTYPENPRVPISEDKDFYDNLDGSMDSFGMVVPIVWNERTGYVVSGNQRLQLLKDAGMTEIEVVVVDYDDNTERAAVVALNNIGGRFKKDELALLLFKIEGDMKNRVGYSGEELKKLLKKLNQRNKDPDAIPEAPEAVTKPGDLIMLGEHRLICGDSTNRDNVVKLVDGKKARMVFTDPPYNCNLGTSLAPCKRSTTRSRVTGASNASIANDNLGAEEWRDFCSKIYANYREFCDGDIYQWGASGPEGMKSRVWLVDSGCHWSATIVWNKGSTILSPSNYLRQYEPCFYGWFEKSSFNNKMNSGNDRTGLSEIWDCKKPTKSELHPTMKPVELCEIGILNSSKEDDIVLDLFGGSGSTLIACERADRLCFMMELEPHYCDVIVKRWEDFTGSKAQRL